MAVRRVVGCRRAPGSGVENREALALAMDVSVPEEVEFLGMTTLKRFGHIDVWVNAAAVHLLGEFDRVPVRDLARVIDVNLKGVLLCSRFAVGQFKRQRRGILVNVSSVDGVVGEPYAAVYSASKFGVRGPDIALREELSEYPDIHVTTVMPSVVGRSKQKL